MEMNNVIRIISKQLFEKIIQNSFTKAEVALMTLKHISPSKIILNRLKKIKMKKIGITQGKEERYQHRRKEFLKLKQQLGVNPYKKTRSTNV